MKKIFFLVTVFLSLNASTTIATNVPAGTVSGIWTLAGSPYYIQGAIQIPNDSTLTIQKAVKVVFQGTYKLSVQGRLLAIGTATDSIIFTASNTTNGWRGIRFDITAATNDTSKFMFCRFQYGKASGTSPNDYGGAFYFNNFSKAVISHCSILNCSAAIGAGIYCTASSPLISYNIIANNTASDNGGGIYSEGGSPNISNNTITYNKASNYGGGISATGGSANIFNNTISQNSVGSLWAGGGGIYSGGSSPNSTNNNIISNNTIINNTSLSNGGGIYCQSGIISKNTISNNTAANLGGGVDLNAITYLSFTGNIISNNTAVNGGGIYFHAPFSTFSDNLICNNTASSNGGGFYCPYNRSNIINSTIANNSAVNGGAMYCDNTSTPNFRNCILYGNTASTSGLQLFITNDIYQPNFYYCDVQGGSTAFETGGNPYIGIYQNNIDSDPLFVAPSGGKGIGFNGLTADWSLKITSPCIDKGDTNGTYPATDMTGNPIVEAYSAIDIAGKPRVNVCRIDFGAYEFQSGIPLAVSLNISQPILCNGSATGQITTLASGGIAPYKYKWSNGDTTKNVSGLIAGTYTVRVSEAGTGCAIYKSTTLIQPLADSIDAGLDKSIICGSSVQLYAKPKWAIINSGTTVNLNSIFFVDANTGYIAGDGGKILKTADGGTNWTIQTSGASKNSIYFINANTGYAVGANGTMYKTTNGGINWNGLTSGTTAQLMSVCFIDALTGYVVGYESTSGNGIILKTINGGNNWTIQTISKSLWSVYFTDANTGYVVGANGTILKTSDGGTNWIPQTSGTTKFLWSVYFTDANTGYAVGDSGTILKTLDKGINWTIQTSGTTSWLYSVYFIDVNTGYVVGSNSTILKTTDGGKNWKAETIAKPAGLTSVFITNNNIAYAVGYYGTIIKISMSKYSSFSWLPSTGLNATNISNPDASPNVTRTYFVTATTTNGCIAKDSVTVNINPLTADAGMDKSITCGGIIPMDSVSSNYTGNGKLNYNWSPSTALNYDTIPNPSSSAIINTRYKVRVTTSNGCDAIDSVKIFVNPLTINGTDVLLSCGDSVLLNTSTNYAGNGNLTYSWLPTTGLNNSSIANPVVKINSDKTYTVTVSTPNGCVARDSVDVKIIPMNAPEICIVGVDNKNKNMIVWNKQSSKSIDSFYIYKETNTTDVYQKIAELNYDSLSVFIDTSSYPKVKSNKYKIAIKDKCGLESIPSSPHKTMHLAINQGMGKTWNLIWDPYQGFTVSTYNIYRGTKTDNLQLIGSSPASNTQYSDLTAPSSGNVYYQVEVVSPNSCNPTRSYNSSLSNIATNDGSGIYKKINASDLFSIYPNPATDNITVIIPQKATLEIINIQGQVVKIINCDKPTTTIDLGHLSNGFYLIKARTDKGITIREFMKL